MKRALAICLAVCTLGFAGFSQFSGSWTGTMNVLPTLELSTMKLTIKYDTGLGWTLTSASTFSGSPIAFTSQDFTLAGAFGPFTMTGTAKFDPVAVAYVSGTLTGTFTFGGITVSNAITHWLAQQTVCSGLGFVAGPNMRNVLTLTISPVTAVLTFWDCCTGFFWHSATITLKGVEICCGVKYDLELKLSKANGFDSLKFTFTNLFSLCCGITVDASITYTTTGKSVTVTPKYAGFGEGCVTVYSKGLFTGGDNADLYWNAIRVDGWRIYCKIADCNFAEYVTFLSPENAGLYFTPNPFITYVAPCALGIEFEYMKLGFCGMGCCGDQYKIDFSIFFWRPTDPADATLFGISRLASSVTIPFFTGFSLTLNFSHTLVVGCLNPTTLSIGWAFTF